MPAILTPDSGSPIFPTSPVTFTVTDTSEAITNLLIAIRHENGTTELIYDGSDFLPVYAGSTKTPITNGFSFSVVRVGGWTDTNVVIAAYPFSGSTGTGINWSTDFTTISDPPDVDVSLSATGVATGSHGDANHVAQIAFDAKGRALSVASIAIAIASAAISDATAAGRAVLTAADASAQRTALGLGSLATASSVTASQISDASAAGRSVLTAASAAAQRTALGLVIGTDVQAHDAELDALAGAGSAADTVPYYTGVGSASRTSLTAAGRAVIGGANAAAQRSSLGLGLGMATVANVAAVRALAAAPDSDGFFYLTRGYTTDGDGGHAFYRWVSSNTDTDDGVTTLKIGAVSTGRFKYVSMGPFNMLQAGFDPTGVTAVAHKLFDVTAILRANGLKDVVFPPGDYKFTGAEQLAPSSTPWDGFTVTFLPGARIVGPTPGPTVGPVGFGIYARGVGDAGEAATIISPDDTHAIPFTDTILGGERLLHAVTDIRSLSVGDHVALYIGAETTDANGWCNSWVIAEIDGITPTTGTAGNVSIKQTLPSPTPAGVGMNTMRTDQTHHSIRKMTGFQDNVTIRGGRLSNVFFAPQFCRNLTLDCESWDYATLAINAFACANLNIPSFVADIVTGYDQGGGGAYSHYGIALDIQSCYGTRVGIYRCDNQDGVGVLSQELSSAGTHVGLIDVTWNSVNSPVSSTQLVNTLWPVQVDYLLSRGGYGAATVSDKVHIDLFEDRGSSTYQTITLRMDQVERMIWRGQAYSGKKQRYLTLPIPSLAGTWVLESPEHGLVRRFRVRTSSLTGVTAIHVDGTTVGTDYGITAFVPSINKWHDINPAMIVSIGSPNFYGFCVPRLKVTTDGSTPAGKAFYLDIEMFVPDLVTEGQLPVDGDDSLVIDRVGDGPPTADSAFVGQRYFDSTNRRWYNSVGVGSGSSDWESHSITASQISDATAAGRSVLTAADASAQRTALGLGSLATASSVTASQISDATAAGRSMVTAANATAQTALLDAASPSTKGLLSAADKTKLDTRDVVHSAPFSGSSVASNTWTAGKYRRLEIHLKVITGAGTDATLTLVGIAAGYESFSTYSFQATATLGGVHYATDWKFQNGNVGPSKTFADVEIASGVKRMFQSRTIDASAGYIVFGHGYNSDMAVDITGISIAFTTSTTGYLEVIGYP